MWFPTADVKHDLSWGIRMGKNRRMIFRCAIFIGAAISNSFALLQQPTQIYYHGDGGHNEALRMSQAQVDSYPQPLPPLQEILARPDPALPPYGVFIWYTEVDDARWRDTVTSFGWKTLRVGQNLGDGSFDLAMENIAGLAERYQVESFYGLNGIARQLFTGTDSAWVKDYVSKVDSVLRMYGPKGTYFTAHPNVPYHPIKYFEVWNEPNLHYMYQGVDYPTKAAYYAKILVATYKHIRANPDWNDVKIIGFAACGASQDDIQWDQYGFIERVFRADSMVARSFDIFSNHPYVFNSPPDAECLVGRMYHYSIARSFATYRNTMKKFGCADKPVWFTEVGWNRSVGADLVAIAERDTVSERLQAAYVTRLYLFCLRLGVDRCTDMYFWDGGTMNGGFISYWGEKDSVVKRESGYATQFLARILPNPKIVQAISDGDHGYWAYKIKRNARDARSDTIIGAWNVIGTKTVNLPCDSGKTYVVYDMLGGKEDRRATSSQLSVEIGPCPIYVQEKSHTGVGKRQIGQLPGIHAIALKGSEHGNTEISFYLKKSGKATVKIFDAQGHLVSIVANRHFESGLIKVRWDGTNAAHTSVNKGMYVVKVSSGSWTISDTMFLTGR